MKFQSEYYTKERAKRQMTAISKVMFYLGTFSLYLDYQAWSMHFRWWHPLTWFIWIIAVAAHGIGNVREVNRSMFLPEEKRKQNYRHAA